MLNKKLSNFLLFSLVIGFSSLRPENFFQKLSKSNQVVFVFEALKSAAIGMITLAILNRLIFSSQHSKTSCDSMVEKQTKKDILVEQLKSIQFHKDEQRSIQLLFLNKSKILFSRQNYLIDAEDINERALISIAKKYNLSASVEKKIYIPSFFRKDTYKRKQNDGIIGLKKVKEAILDAISQIKLGKRVDGILLEGPPGVGKTLLSSELAKYSGVHFVKFNNPNGKWAGEAQRAIREFFAQIRSKQKPCIIFIDEIDTMLSDRNDLSTENDHKREMVNALLDEMDGADKSANNKFLFIGATNRFVAIDEAAKRSPRFGSIFNMSFPTKNERQEMLLYYLRDKNYSEDINEEYIQEIAGKMGGFSGADISGVVVRADQLARISKQSINIKFFNEACLETFEKKKISFIAKNNVDTKDKATRIAKSVVLSKIYEKKGTCPYVVKKATVSGGNNITQAWFVANENHTLRHYLTVYILDYFLFEQNDKIDKDLFGLRVKQSKDFLKNEYFLQTNIYDVVQKYKEIDIDFLLNEVKKMRNEAEKFLLANKKVIDILSSLLFDEEALDKAALDEFFGQNKLVVE